MLFHTYLIYIGYTLPDVLYLQLDNTSKGNKCKEIVGYCGWLVDWKVFKKIIVSFLPVGHTHEDIDQFFSRLAIYLKCHNAPSRVALGQCVTQAYRLKNAYPLQCA